MQRGDVVLANLEPVIGSEQGGRRPAIIVSRDAINKHSSVVIVVPLTGKENKDKIFRSQTVLPAGLGGLSKSSIVLGEQVRSISKKRIVKVMGRLPDSMMIRIDEALRIALSLEW